MARLPTPGADGGVWGDVLNDFLEVSHNTDGTLKAPLDIGSGLVTINAQGQMTVSPTSGVTGVIAKASDDGVDTLQVQDTLGTVVGAMKPNGLYVKPNQLSSVGLFIDGSALDGSSLLVDLENSGSLFTVATNGATTISTNGTSSVNLAIPAKSGQSANLQEWRDSSGNALSWIASDGTPGGKLAEQSVVSINGSINFPYPAPINFGHQTSVPVDASDHTYGGYKHVWNSPAYSFSSGTIATISDFAISNIDTRAGGYKLDMVIYIINGDGTQQYNLHGVATAQASNASDSATLAPSGYATGGSGGDLSYNSSSGAITSASGGTYTTWVQITGSWL